MVVQRTVSKQPMWQGKGTQTGATLITVLVMLLLILMLGLAAAQIALQGEKAARNDRDRHIAFQAAEAALLDAEIAIEHSPDAATSRHHIFTRQGELDFPLPDQEECASAASNVYPGLCDTVPYGRFTGNQFLTGVAALPAMAPRYAIELMVDHKVTLLTGKPAYFYRITAIGYGARVSTQVVLQSVYRKQLAAALPGEPSSMATGRLSWREMINWPELNAAGN